MERNEENVFSAIRRYWFVVLAAGIIAILLGAAYSVLSPGEQLYSADATVVVQDPAAAIS